MRGRDGGLSRCQARARRRIYAGAMYPERSSFIRPPHRHAQGRSGPSFWLARAQLARRRCGAQASLDLLQTANPGSYPRCTQLYARRLEAQGKYKEALDEYRFSSAPSRRRSALPLCALLRLTGATDEARAAFNEVVKSLDGARGIIARTERVGEIAKRIWLRSNSVRGFVAFCASISSASALDRACTGARVFLPVFAFGGIAC